MEPIETVDELIARLQELRERAGGDCRVMLRFFGRELTDVHCSLGAADKSDPYREVMRGGFTCVIVSG